MGIYSDFTISSLWFIWNNSFSHYTSTACPLQKHAHYPCFTLTKLSAVRLLWPSFSNLNTAEELYQYLLHMSVAGSTEPIMWCHPLTVAAATWLIRYNHRPTPAAASSQQPAPTSDYTLSASGPASPHLLLSHRSCDVLMWRIYDTPYMSYINWTDSWYLPI